MWRSKLGGVYSKAEIEAMDGAMHAKLSALRKLPENRVCADCGAQGTVWAIVNHGVFVCMRCGALHRSLGTHVSVPKGCTGTYLWGPDEVQAMIENGNAKSNARLGGERIPRPPPGASDDVMVRHLKDKYERRVWAVAPASPPPQAPPY
ncbi:hypothetical protein CTAYLR_000018 [Chrysophaeum taylorii]|uniref:Arf-GAP domain-containing protein n=1 Tax=Chrysophaeum taylorii TaxID=2483200 RepID=A0AAD7UI44_9STRA|nr:hypothetical protein CTAYLR_000018 [Chrysophaeum taylorii]